MIVKTEQDMCALAADVRLAGELLEGFGFRALTVTEQWKPGAASARLSPGDGQRYEVVVFDGDPSLVAVPSDRTGEAAITGDDLGRFHDELVDALERARRAAVDINHIVRLACPPGTTALKAEEMTRAQISAMGWCVSCHRDGGYIEPVAMSGTSGKRRYRDYCRFCGSWESDHGQEPPLRLVQLRRQGVRLTTRVVAEVLAAVAADEEAERAKRRDEKKKRKAKRKAA